jgi:hypothetical protein
MASVPVELEAPAPPRSVVSGTSILLFSAFLAGMVFGQVLPKAQQFHAFTGAAAGVIAYIGLWYTTRVKEQMQVTRTQEKVTRKLEKKLGKHLSSRRSFIAGVSRRLDSLGG